LAEIVTTATVFNEVKSHELIGSRGCDAESGPQLPSNAAYHEPVILLFPAWVTAMSA
jgi:hypothetical protein